jgi:hypothetical protein
MYAYAYWYENALLSDNKHHDTAAKMTGMLQDLLTPLTAPME